MSRKTNASKSVRARRFRVLGDENRLRLIETLFQGPANVTSLANLLGLEQSLTSHHLASLRKEGLVETFRDGKEVFYCLAKHIIAGNSCLELGCCQITLH
ncbi:MAG: ArsR/SmtB family transcription factor [Oligoflexus sp.]